MIFTVVVANFIYYYFFFFSYYICPTFPQYILQIFSHQSCHHYSSILCLKGFESTDHYRHNHGSHLQFINLHIHYHGDHLNYLHAHDHKSHSEFAKLHIYDHENHSEVADLHTLRHEDHFKSADLHAHHHAGHLEFLEDILQDVVAMLQSAKHLDIFQAIVP